MSSTLPRDLALVIAEDPPPKVAWVLVEECIVKLACPWGIAMNVLGATIAAIIGVIIAN